MWHLMPFPQFYPKSITAPSLHDVQSVMWDSLWRYVTYRKIIQSIWTEFDTGSYKDSIHGLKQ
jgi:hypothetical protein